MTQFDHQLLTTLFLSEGPQIRDNPALKAISRIATMFILVAGTGLLAVAAADRLDAASTASSMTIAPSPEYLHAVATLQASERTEAAAPSAAPTMTQNNAAATIEASAR